MFDVFYVFFGNRPDTQTMAIYNQNTIVGDGHVGYGAAISVAIFLIIALFVVIYVTFMRVRASNERRRRSDGASRSHGRSRAAHAAKPVGRKRSAGVPFYLLVAAIFVYALFPFYWAIRSAFTPETSSSRRRSSTSRSTRRSTTSARCSSSGFFQRALLNSTIVAGSVTLLSLAIGSLAAYALGRFRFRGRSFVMYLMLSMTIFPQIAILGALYTMINDSSGSHDTPRGR